MNVTERSRKLSFGMRCERGYQRQENQDYIGHFVGPQGETFLIADGMGGHMGGAVASRMTVEKFEQYSRLRDDLPMRESVAETVRLVNTDIFHRGHEGNAETEGMGSTLVAAIFQDGMLTIGHIGDSRCYALEEQALRIVTRDHSAVQYLVDAGLLTPEQARKHPDSSVLTRALGQNEKVEIEFAEPIAIHENSVFMLCSDGLYGYVSHAAIEERLRAIEDPQAAADSLIELALAAGGPDNVSVCVIRIGSEVAPPVKTPPQPVPSTSTAISSSEPAKRSHTRSMAGSLAAALVLICGVGVAYYFRNDLAHAIPGFRKPSSLSQQSRQEPIPPPPAVRVPPETAPTAQQAVVSVATPDQGTKPPATKVRVVIVYPPEEEGGQMKALLEIERKLSADGFLASHNRKQVRAGLVWGMVLPASAFSSPPKPIISAVYIPGHEQEAARVCFLAHCLSEGPTLVKDRDLMMFKENFPGRSIALFVRQGSRSAIARKMGKE